MGHERQILTHNHSLVELRERTWQNPPSAACSLTLRARDSNSLPRECEEQIQNQHWAALQHNTKAKHETMFGGPALKYFYPNRYNSISLL